MKEVLVNDIMQKNYRYLLTEPMGQNFQSDFQPQLTPKEMLELGVFGGKYMNDCYDEFPVSWFENAKISTTKNIQLNYFKVQASLPLSHWREKGWIYNDDPRGWFQWYCRYKNGRRIPEIDLIQIKRWKAFGDRHGPAVKKNCDEGDLQCRRRQRQALLQWAYNPFF